MVNRLIAPPSASVMTCIHIRSKAVELPPDDVVVVKLGECGKELLEEAVWTDIE